MRKWRQWTEHVFVGAGDGPCVILAVGTRLSDAVVYPVSELAQQHRAGVEHETRDPGRAYADIRADGVVGYRQNWLCCDSTAASRVCGALDSDGCCDWRREGGAPPGSGSRESRAPGHVQRTVGGAHECACAE